MSKEKALERSNMYECEVSAESLAKPQIPWRNHCGRKALLHFSIELNKDSRTGVQRLNGLDHICPVQCWISASRATAPRARLWNTLLVSKVMVQIFTVLKVFSIRMWMLKICSTALLPALKPACSCASSLSAIRVRRLCVTFTITLLGWLIKIIVQ